jgi:NADH-ubiquinone oxidoreductase chain 4
MLTLLLLIIPLCGVISLSTAAFQKFFVNDLMEIKIIALTTSIINIIISLIILIFYDFSVNHFQFLQDFDKVKFCDFYSGLDGISIYFVLVTTIITPIALLSNWSSIKVTVRAYAIIILLLETLLLAVFLLLDVFLFYVFFESILPPLFILIGLFGSNERVRASFYLFLYTFILKCIKAKYRVNPKTLVIKVIREILLPA